MEDGVDRGQADVLVDAAVTRHVVRVEQLVVVGQVISGRIDRLGIAGEVVGVGLKHARGDDRHGVVRNVDQELGGRAHRIGDADAQPAIGGRVAFHEEIVARSGKAVRTLHHHLRSGRLDP